MLVFNMMWQVEIFQNLNKRTTADKLLYDKAFNFVKNPKYCGLASKCLTSMVC